MLFLLAYGITRMTKNQLELDPINATFKRKKEMQKYIVKYIAKWISPEQLIYLKQCGSFLDFVSDFDREKHKLVFANSCKNRFCPICNFKLSKKKALMIECLLRAINYNYNYDYYFVTLTTPNVTADRLEDEIKLFNSSVSKLFRRKAVLDISKGYVRKLEITYNEESKTYNPHVHLILAVNSSYSKNPGYLTKKDWLALWRDVTGKNGFDERGRDEISQLSVEHVTDKTKAVFEIAKYAAKDFDLIYDEEVFDTFYKSFKGKQQLTFNGIFKDFAKKYKNHELDDYMIKDQTDYYWFIHSIFDQEQKMYKNEYKKLTEEQKVKFNIK